MRFSIVPVLAAVLALVSAVPAQAQAYGAESNNIVDDASGPGSYRTSAASFGASEMGVMHRQRCSLKPSQATAAEKLAVVLVDSARSAWRAAEHEPPAGREAEVERTLVRTLERDAECPDRHASRGFARSRYIFPGGSEQSGVRPDAHGHGRCGQKPVMRLPSGGQQRASLRGASSWQKRRRRRGGDSPAGRASTVGRDGGDVDHVSACVVRRENVRPRGGVDQQALSLLAEAGDADDRRLRGTGAPLWLKHCSTATPMWACVTATARV